MLKPLTIAVVLSLGLAPQASALSGDEKTRCVALKKDLPARQQDLQERQSVLADWKSQAELAGEEYVSAKEIATLSPEYDAAARDKKVAFDKKRADVAQASTELQVRSDAFNADIAWFNAKCTGKK